MFALAMCAAAGNYLGLDGRTGAQWLEDKILRGECTIVFQERLPIPSGSVEIVEEC
jgi:hypothetical protein